MFEQDDIALPRVAAFFHRESVREQAQAEAMLNYLSDHGGQYCNKDIQVDLILIGIDSQCCSSPSCCFPIDLDQLTLKTCYAEYFRCKTPPIVKI